MCIGYFGIEYTYALKFVTLFRTINMLSNPLKYLQTGHRKVPGQILLLNCYKILNGPR